MTVTEKTWQLHKPKGEWRICGTGSMAEIREDGRTIAYPALCSSEAESDNRLALMAAAPELLEALQRLLSYHGDCGPTGGIHTEESCSVCAAHAAISKAEGA